MEACSDKELATGYRLNVCLITDDDPPILRADMSSSILQLVAIRTYAHTNLASLQHHLPSKDSIPNLNSEY